MIHSLKKILKSKTCLFIAFCMVLFGFARVYNYVTDDFSLSNMTYDMPYHKEWEISNLSQEEAFQLDKILDQKFNYLGKGAQSYVFSSEDDQYVLKFFKFKHLKPSIFVKSLPSIYPFADYKNKALLRINRKLHSAFNGYKTAYAVHKNESGLVYIHLNKTSTLKKTVTITDKIGRNYFIDLDQNVFLIQKKGESLKTVLTNLIKNKDLPLAKWRIEQVFDLYISEYQKGIYDIDKRVMSNTGFIGKKTIHLDVGNFVEKDNVKEKAVYQNNLTTIYQKIDTWLQKHFPEERDEITQDVRKKYLEKIESIF